MKKLAVLGICIVLALTVLAVGCGEDEEPVTTVAPQTTAAPETTTTAAPDTTAPPETTASTAPPETTATTAATGVEVVRDVIADVEPIELSFVSFLPDVPPGSDWNWDFMNKVSEYSGGAMTVKFSGPEACSPMDVPAAVQRGTFDLGSILSMFGDTMVPLCAAVGRAEYNPIELRTPGTPANAAYKYYEDGYAANGIKYLGASVSSEAQVQTVFYFGKDINTLADLKGLKMAAVGGSNQAFIEELGMACIPIDFTDYFTSMERGVVDGFNVGIPGIEDYGLTPLTKVMLDEPVSSCGGMMLMNMDKWNGLTDKQKQVITQAMIATEYDNLKHFNDTVDAVKGRLEAAGVKILHLSPEEAKTFYLAYRDTMWAQDIKDFPEEGKLLYDALVNPDFHLAK